MPRGSGRRREEREQELDVSGAWRGYGEEGGEDVDEDVDVDDDGEGEQHRERRRATAPAEATKTRTRRVLEEPMGDMERGTGEWENIPDVVRVTFATLVEVARQQARRLRELERAAEKVGPAAVRAEVAAQVAEVVGDRTSSSSSLAPPSHLPSESGLTRRVDALEAVVARLREDVETLKRQQPVGAPLAPPHAQAQAPASPNRAAANRINVHELNAVLSQKVDSRTLVEALRNLPERDELERVQARVEEVAKALEEVKTELDRERVEEVAGFAQSLESRVEEVAVAMAAPPPPPPPPTAPSPTLMARSPPSDVLDRLIKAVATEATVGRWIWRGGELRGSIKAKGTAGLVPWSVQTANTSEELFSWTPDADHVTAHAQGLYEVCVGVFTDFDPAVQLLVNDEVVLSREAGSAPSSSGRGGGGGGAFARRVPHSAGNVTGVTHVDFVALPGSGARVAVRVAGVEPGHAQAFLSLRRI